MNPLAAAPAAAPGARPWLSILIPVYNAEPHLQACFDSFLAQAEAGRAGEVEVIALDDASTDGSGRRLDSLAAQHPGLVQVLRHPANRGQSAARNAMIDTARGDYLWFIDADDVVEPGALAQLRAVVQAQAPDLVLCDYRVLRERAGRRHRWRGENHRHTFDGPAGVLEIDTAVRYVGLMVAMHMHIWSKIARRSLWTEDLRFPVGRCYEDLYLSPRLALKARSHVYCPQVWIAYRQHAGSTLAQLTPRKLQDLIEALDELAADLANSPMRDDPEARFALSHTCARSMIAALRGLQRLNAEPAALVRAREAFHRASPLPAGALIREYARRGWWARAVRLAWWLRQLA